MKTLALFSSAIAVSLGLFGCASPEEKHAKMVERAGPPQPPLAATTTYFDQTLTARIVLGPVTHPGFQSNGAAGPERPSGGERHSGGGQGGMQGGGMGAMHGGMGGGGGHGGAGAESHAGSGKDHAGPQGGGHAAPPRHALQVAFTNQGKETIEFSVSKMKSILGDFAVRPAQLALAPGQRGELDPMLSALVPAALDDLDVEITVRSDGKAETQTVRLVPVPAPDHTKR